MEILYGKTILVVDDEEYNWLLFKGTLEDVRAEFLWARVGQEAIDLVSSGRKIDLILMDIKMPFMDGFTATREIKKINSNIPVIAQTAYATQDERLKCYEAGCDDYVSKPIDYEDLKRKMARILKKKVLN
ncbi:MAG: response regulator [Bacteroidales bacterium]|nr:response regulator [Bacteroidales bacterium]